jgi:hypothetical protein
MTTLPSPALRAWLALPLVLSLLVATGCNKTGAADASASKPSPAGNARGAGSYEIVTVTRPESVDAYHAPYRAMYEICASSRELVKLPPAAPMKKPAPDFIEQRDTFVRDGDVFLHKRENFAMKLVSSDPKAGCDTRLEASTEYELYRDGKVISVALGDEGRSEQTNEWSNTNHYGADLTSNYTERKTIRGTAVRCQKLTVPGLDKLVQDICIADGSPRAPTDVNDEPITVSTRVVNPVMPSVVMITEPVSVKLGVPIDPKVFNLAGKN